MEVIILSPTVNFNYDSATSSPNRITSPSSPNRFGTCFFSAPTSPTSFFHHFSTSPATTSGCSPSTIPSHWELKPKIPKPKDQSVDHDDDDFQFDSTGRLQKTSLPAADELFHGGIIRTLKPPPPTPSGLNDPIKSQQLPINTKNRRDSASLRSKKCDFGKLAVVKQSRNFLEKRNKNKEGRERGREKTSNLESSSRKQRGTKSLSPFSESSKKNSNSSTSSKSKDSLSKKWKLRDLWLKKSSKEELKKYSVLKKNSVGEDVKELSFRSTESGGGGGLERRRGAAERHYAATRAAAEEMRRKTVLPYKHGLLGCMGFSFNPAVHEISRGIGSLTRG